jgi:thioredoxin 1
VNVKDLSANEWKQEVLQSNILTVVDFWHKHCSFCLKLNPIFTKVAENYEGKIKFIKFNVMESSESRDIALNHGIMSTPTLMFFCAGRVVGQFLGFMPKEELTRVMEDMLKRYKDCLYQSSAFNHE